MSAEKPCCQTGPKWVCDRLKDKNALAPLTGQDWRALQAFVHLVALYGSSDTDGRGHAIEAMRHTVVAMQSSTRHLAKAAIPHMLDWDDEERVWNLLASRPEEA
jgi:hypothetical protein